MASYRGCGDCGEAMAIQTQISRPPAPIAKSRSAPSRLHRSAFWETCLQFNHATRSCFATLEDVFRSRNCKCERVSGRAEPNPTGSRARQSDLAGWARVGDITRGAIVG